MCDLKSFSFSHHFGSGFKYFSATIIRKLSKMLNLRLSGGLIYKYTYNIQVFRKGLRGRICKKVVPKCLIYVCILLVHFSLELVPRFKSGKGGGWSPSSISQSVSQPPGGRGTLWYLQIGPEVEKIR